MVNMVEKKKGRKVKVTIEESERERLQTFFREYAPETTVIGALQVPKVGAVAEVPQHITEPEPVQQLCRMCDQPATEFSMQMSQWYCLRHAIEITSFGKVMGLPLGRCQHQSTTRGQCEIEATHYAFREAKAFCYDHFILALDREKKA